MSALPFPLTLTLTRVNDDGINMTGVKACAHVCVCVNANDANDRMIIERTIGGTGKTNDASKHNDNDNGNCNGDVVDRLLILLRSNILCCS